MLDDVLPVRGVIESAQIWLQLAAENLQRSTLANTVGSHETKNLARSRHRKPVEFEAVGAISVGDLVLEVRGQVDDGDGIEGALFRADTATDTEALGDECETRLGGDFYTKLAAANNRARLFALLTALARATLSEEGRSVGTAGHEEEAGETAENL